MMKSFLLFLLALLVQAIAFSQRKDSVGTKKNSSVIVDTVGKEVMKIDTLAKKKFIPRQATIRSAIIPGWGQVYNKKYWKLPLVYGALGATAYVFFDNLQVYRDSRYAYKAKYQASMGDSSLLPDMKPEYMVYSMES